MYNSDGEQLPAPRGVASRSLVRLVRLYQKHLSPLKMYSTCRFTPTCSAYAVEAVARHGAAKGSLMAIVRLSKCGPWHPGGYDPVVVAGDK
ncbi:membrane protein insertion efficiency factor YidD [Corynebacterium aquatimens]|uniref:membrane protein insertion efficiency factor YidD n=1 Tax=Corynebacterium aquatimens TaxID=1190508 RepID=UPI001E65B0C2|nr:membrane protein insertion efficiency factor YidD [Corynebacterium aquatimens]